MTAPIPIPSTGDTTALSTSAEAIGFDFVDTAIGGTNKRNHVVRIIC
jgi:hypothetical protein